MDIRNQERCVDSVRMVERPAHDLHMDRILVSSKRPYHDHRLLVLVQLFAQHPKQCHSNRINLVDDLHTNAGKRYRRCFEEESNKIGYSNHIFEASRDSQISNGM